MELPVPALDAGWPEEETKALFQAQCSLCHGVAGRADGPLAAVYPVADLSSDRVQGQADAVLAWKIGEGRAPMPSFRSSFGEKQIWDLVHLIRSFAPGQPVEHRSGGNDDASQR